jgi:hypothetical protein
LHGFEGKRKTTKWSENDDGVPLSPFTLPHSKKKKKNAPSSHHTTTTMALPAVALVAVAVIALLALAALATAARARRATPFLDGATFKPLTLTHRVELTHNTRMFR